MGISVVGVAPAQAGAPCYTITSNVVSAGSSCTGDIVLPDTATSIAANAFNGASSLTSISIPSGVTAIARDAFRGASSLETVTFAAGSSLTTIGDRAFLGTTSLNNITIPASVTFIGLYVFYDTKVEILVDSSNENYSAADGNLFNKNQTSIIAYPTRNTRTSYTIPVSVTSIGEGAFEGASLLTSLTFPASVTTINDYAFSGTSSLATITFGAGNALSSIGAFSFEGATSLVSLTLPAGVASIGEGAFDGASLLNRVNFTGDAPSVGVDAFNGVSSGATAYVYVGSTGFTLNAGKWNRLNIEEVAPEPTSGACGLVTANGPSYYPCGPQANVLASTVINGGWELCWSGAYNGFAKFSDLYARCTGDYLMYAGWEGVSTSPETLPSQIRLLAAAPRADVFYVTNSSYPEDAHLANGSGWYFADDRDGGGDEAVGFGPADNMWSGSPCGDAPLGLCWHSAPNLFYWNRSSPSIPEWAATEPGLSPGWSLAGITSLGQNPENGGSNYTRAIFQYVAIDSGRTDSEIAEDLAKEVASARAVAIAKSKNEILSTLVAGKSVTAQQLRDAEIRGFTDKNISLINAELSYLTTEAKNDFSLIAKVIRKYEVIDLIASDMVSTVSSQAFVEIGLLDGSNKSKTAILMSIRKLPAEKRSDYVSVASAIKQEMAKIQVRKDRLKAVITRRSN